jgi:hypothetical protein
MNILGIIHMLVPVPTPSHMLHSLASFQSSLATTSTVRLAVVLVPGIATILKTLCGMARGVVDTPVAVRERESRGSSRNYHSDIEVRVCASHPQSNDEDALIEIISLFVQ